MLTYNLSFYHNCIKLNKKYFMPKKLITELQQNLN